MKFSHARIVFALVGMASVSTAQVAEKEALTLDGARQVIAAAVAQAKRVDAPGAVIAVVDDGGNLMALERLDNTFAAGGLYRMRLNIAGAGR